MLEYKKLIVRHFNSIFVLSEESKKYWKNISVKLQEKYPGGLSEDEIEANLKSKVMGKQLYKLLETRNGTTPI